MSVSERYCQWINEPASNWFLWYLKSLLQGVPKTKLWVYFILVVVGCAGTGVWIELIKNGLSPTGDNILKPLCVALPPLIGATGLDYLLEEPEPSSVLWTTVLAEVISFVCVLISYINGLMGPIFVAVVITLLLTWMIKGRDRKFSSENNNDNAVGGDLNNDVSGKVGEDKV